MNFRRQPFQFSAIDPAKRQAELQKRFGLPATNSDMFVDFLNPGSMGSGIKESSSLSGSPRLQHRVPLFTGNADKISSRQNNVDSGHKPRVRVVPIQVEGVDGDKRQRTFSGPAGMVDESNGLCKDRVEETLSHLDSTKGDERLKKPNQPKVCTVPIQIKTKEEKQKVVPSSETPEPTKKLKAEPNGCAASSNKKEGPAKRVPLQQIDKVLLKLKEYEDGVEKFSGTTKDKQYRYLDEMLTRCILDLDNVDTMGLDDVRKARKAAVKQVQYYVDLLDTRVKEQVEKMDSDSSVVNPVVDSNDEDTTCDIPTEASNTSSPDSNNMKNESTSGDVEMTEEKVVQSDSIPDFTNEEIEVHTRGGLIENGELMDCFENTSPVPVTNMESTLLNPPNTEMKDCGNKSQIAIKELVDNLEKRANDGTTEIGGHVTVPCIVSDSPEVGFKNTVTVGDSEIVIKEVTDSSETGKNLNGKDIVDSINNCASDEKLSVEQLNIKGDFCDVSSDVSVPVVQEDLVNAENL